MTIGVLFEVNCAVGNNTCFTGPVGITNYLTSINICNKGPAPAKVRLAITSVTSPTVWIEYDYPLDPTEAIERTGFMCQPGYHVVVYSDSATVDVVGQGYQEPIV